MKNILLTVIVLFLGMSASAETVMKCAVNNISGATGARVNLLQNANGKLKANLIFGTTVSGTMYQVTETRTGVYEGAIRGDNQSLIKLSVKPTQAENNHIRGFTAALEVTYPDYRHKPKYAHFKSSARDNFVCGKQISPFGK